MALLLREPRPQTLPALQPKVNYRGFPRRYEETKPVVVQEFTHRRIVSLGDALQQQTLLRCSLEKDEAVKQAERHVWDQAELLKRETVEKAVSKLHLEHEKAMKKLVKAHERALKEEAVRVEGQMQKLALEQVQEAQQVGERKLQQAVTKAQQKGHDELVLAVAKARKEEQDVALQQRQKLQKEADQKLASTIQAAAQDKQQVLMELTQKKDAERKAAVEDAHHYEQKSAAKRLADQKELNDQNVRILQTHIAEKKRDIVVLREEIEAHIRQKEIVRQELIETREEFDLFISRVKPFNDTEAGFLLPPAKTIVKT